MTAEKQDRSTKKVSIVRRNLLIGAAGAPLLLTLQAKNLMADSLNEHTAQSTVGAPFSCVLTGSNGTSALETELYNRIVSTSSADLKNYYGTPGNTYYVSLDGNNANFIWMSDPTDCEIAKSATYPFTLTYEQNYLKNIYESSYTLTNATITFSYDADECYAVIIIAPASGYTLQYTNRSSIVEDEFTGTLAEFDARVKAVEAVSASS